MTLCPQCHGVRSGGPPGCPHCLGLGYVSCCDGPVGNAYEVCGPQKEVTLRKVCMTIIPFHGAAKSSVITEAEAVTIRNVALMRPGHVTVRGIENGCAIEDEAGKILLVLVEPDDSPERGDTWKKIGDVSAAVVASLSAERTNVQAYSKQEDTQPQDVGQDTSQETHQSETNKSSLSARRG